MSKPFSYLISLALATLIFSCGGVNPTMGWQYGFNKDKEKNQKDKIKTMRIVTKNAKDKVLRSATHHFRKDGLVQMEEISEEASSFTLSYSYNENGQLQSIMRQSAQAMQKTEEKFTYDLKSGLPYGTLTLGEEPKKKVFYFDSNKNLIEQKLHHRLPFNDSLKIWKQQEMYTFEYSSRGLLEEEKYFVGVAEELEHTYKYFNDIEGQCVEREQWKNDQLVRTEAFEYKKNGLITKETHSILDEVILTKTYTYDKNDRLVSVIIDNVEANQKTRLDYSYTYH